MDVQSLQHHFLQEYNIRIRSSWLKQCIEFINKFHSHSYQSQLIDSVSNIFN